MALDATKILKTVIGDVVTCRHQIKKLQEELNSGALALKPCSFDLQKNLESLTRYSQEVQSYIRCY